MKKLLLLLVGVLLACSSDSEDSPKLGQYIYETGAVTASVNVGSRDVGITVFLEGRYAYQDLRGSATGSWPTYQYVFDGITLQCTYSSAEAFKAVASSGSGVPLPASTTFIYNSKVLDENGDGILDSWR